MVTHQAQNRERTEPEENSDDMVYDTQELDTFYREAVGSLLNFVNATRPDTRYALNVLRDIGST